jgi:prophage antirepressor-like protein
MTNLVKMFNFNNAEIRTVIDDTDNSVWFVAKDIADALDYSETSAMTRKLDDDEVMSAKLADMNMNSVFINESGLYSCILSSSKPSAKEFKRWVTHDVLPTIRKTGKYDISQSEYLQLRQENQELLEYVSDLNQLCDTSTHIKNTMQTDLDEARYQADFYKWVVDGLKETASRWTVDERCLVVTEIVNSLTSDAWAADAGSSVFVPSGVKIVRLREPNCFGMTREVRIKSAVIHKMCENRLEFKSPRHKMLVSEAINKLCDNDVLLSYDGWYVKV